MSYNLRRAEEERRKAEETLSEHDRALRLEIAGIFEARAKAVPTLH